MAGEGDGRRWSIYLVIRPRAQCVWGIRAFFSICQLPVRPVIASGFDILSGRANGSERQKATNKKIAVFLRKTKRKIQFKKIPRHLRWKTLDPLNDPPRKAVNHETDAADVLTLITPPPSFCLLHH